MESVPRRGDTRPYRRDAAEPIRWILNVHSPFRWLPRHGDPSCYLEWTSQKIIRLLAYLPIYTAIIATLVLLVEIFGVPFVGGR